MVIISSKHKINGVGNSDMTKQSHKELFKVKSWNFSKMFGEEKKVTENENTFKELLLFVFIYFLLCVVYKLYFIIGMHLQGWCWLVLGAHEES